MVAKLLGLGFLLVGAGVFFANRSDTAEVTFRKPSAEVLRKQLTAEQYHVTQEAGTERPFHNAYWHNEADGIYVDVVSGEPLFSSLDKFDSGTGWPSFTQSVGDHVVFRRDATLGALRTEVVSKVAGSHLGHVFDDGPAPTGKRFCMNSAALRFVPLEALQKEGLGAYLFAFADKRGWDVATLAGGCFWGMEEILGKLPGVIATQVGYTGGDVAFPSYHQVSTGDTGHAESLQILFDPAKLTYEQIVLYFFRMHDPTTLNRQVNDVGSQYRSAIFYRSDAQKRTAEAVRARVDKSGKWGKPVVTQIAPLKTFWRAEPEHQNYLERNPNGYSCHTVRDFTF